MKKYIPNILSLIRLFLSPLLLISWIRGNKKQSYIICGICIITDNLDGFLARRWEVATQTGEWLDKVVDTVWGAAGIPIVLKEQWLSLKQLMIFLAVFFYFQYPGELKQRKIGYAMSYAVALAFFLTNQRRVKE